MRSLLCFVLNLSLISDDHIRNRFLTEKGHLNSEEIEHDSWEVEGAVG